MRAKKPQIVVDPTTLPGNLVYSQNKSKATDIPFEETEKESAREEGKIEATKETAKEEEKNSNRLNNLLDKSTDVLYQLRNIIPIFTSELIINTNKITVIHRPFFFSERIHQVSIKDVSDVYIDTVPFIASIYIVDRYFVENQLKLRWVWKGKAEKARRIITGLMETAKEEIDVTKLGATDLAEKLEEIGKVREANTTVSKV